MTEPEPVIERWNERWLQRYLEFLDSRQRARILRSVLAASRAAGLEERQRRREEQLRRRERERREAS